MTILPLYAAPQYAEQVTDWIWQAFGDGLPRAFFHSIVEHSQTPGALPLTFIALENEQLVGTVGLWRCDLITRQDLAPGWQPCMWMMRREARGWRGCCKSMLSTMPHRPGMTRCISGLPAVTSTNITAGSISAMRWSTRTKRYISIAIRPGLRRVPQQSDGALTLD